MRPRVGGASGTGSLVSVDELLREDGSVVGILSTAETGGTGGAGERTFEDSLILSNAATSLMVNKDILLLTTGLGGTAKISTIEQTFMTPEPGILGLLAVGLLGLTVAGRRRR